MQQEKIFLTAEWRKLVMANYRVDPAVLQPLVPPGTELDTWNDTHYVSLVGFMFCNTKVLGIGFPFHRNFEEVNLRFYVRFKGPEGWRRGVVFVKEIVPKAGITFVANTLYKEHYQTLPMRHSWEEGPDGKTVEYGWKVKGSWNFIRVKTKPEPTPIPDGSEAEFITEHYWGYTQQGAGGASEYQVEHPRWNVYEVTEHAVTCDTAILYGPQFSEALDQPPLSVFMAEGSEILVRKGRRIV
jgi:uncharacterized protein YqjF (DUF2071 family)